MAARTQRGLPPAAERLYQVLVRERMRRSVAVDEMFIADLDVLRRRARIASYATVKWALAQLRRARLVATARDYVKRWVWDDSAASWAKVNAAEHNWYVVADQAGAEVPREAAITWQPGWTEEARASIAEQETEREARAQAAERALDQAGAFAGSPSCAARLTANYYPSVLSSLRNQIFSQRERRTADADFFLAPNKGIDHDPVDLAALFGCKEVTSWSLTGTAQVTWLPECPQLPIDPAPPLASIVTIVPHAAVPEVKVRTLIDGYRRAVEQVYGTRWFGFHRELRFGENEALRKHKSYKALLAAAVACAEGNAPPEHFAIWRLEYMRANMPGFAKKPPPILLVMNAKSVSKMAKWFRKAYVLPQLGHVAEGTVRMEQYWRNREVQNITRPGMWRWAGLTKQYVAMRIEEIKRGLDHPHENWPTQKGRPHG